MDPEDLDAHIVIDTCQKVLTVLLERTPEGYLLASRGRIDEQTMDSLPPLISDMPDPEADLAAEALALLKLSVNQLWTDYTPAADIYAKIFGRRYNISSQDSASASSIGLHKATFRFAPAEGSTPESRRRGFMTYLSFWVRQTIQKELAQNMRESRTLDMPVGPDGGRTRLETLTYADSMWHDGCTVEVDDEAMEALRLQYCPELTMAEMKELLDSADLIDQAA